MPVTPKTLRLSQQMRRDLLALVAQHEKKITGAWVDAWDDLAGDLEAALRELVIASVNGVLSQATILRSQRLALALDVVARRLTRLTNEAGATVTADLPKLVQDASAAQRAIIATQLPAGEMPDVAPVAQRALDVIVQRSTERVTSQMWPLSAEADAAMRREIVRGLATGRGPRDTASAIVKRAEGQFNGGLSRALTIARTETLDAHRKAAEQTQNENADVLGGWMWLAATSARTCPACLAMNGTKHPLTEPGPLGHPNCRCTRVPVTKTWAELGIDLDEPEPAATGSQAWFDAQSEQTQRKILGPTRYAAYQRGDYPMTAWAARRKNDGWRDSYVTSPAPKAA
jgi:SPP1 gp7 family putative phage head morphogenesis protein